MKPFAIRFLLCAVLALGLAPLRAQEHTLVDVDDANPPFMFAAQGHAAGVYPALLAAAFREMGVPVVIEPKPWRRALAEIDTGHAGVGGIYKNAERLQRFDYSDALFVERVNVYTLRGRLRYANLADLAGKRVGVIRGWSYGDDFDALRKSGAVTTEDVASDGQNFAKLEAGRLDAVLAIAEAAEPLLRKHPQAELAGTLAENPTYLAFNKSVARLDLLQRFNAALGRLRASGESRRIVSEALQRP
jgi:polar amino acid transport system substrate-binding protein